jgi:hypothetical protein
MTRADVVTIACLAAVIVAGGFWFYFYALQTDRYKITEFCKPRGYTGGFIRNGHQFGCVRKDGQKFLIEDIRRAETPAKIQNRFIDQ